MVRWLDLDLEVSNSKLTRPAVSRGKSAGSFPEQRLVIDPTGVLGSLGTTFLHINGALGTILLSMTFISSQQNSKEIFAGLVWNEEFKNTAAHFLPRLL